MIIINPVFIVNIVKNIVFLIFILEPNLIKSWSFVVLGAADGFEVSSEELGLVELAKLLFMVWKLKVLKFLVGNIHFKILQNGQEF